MKVEIFRSNLNSIFANLAVEEALFSRPIPRPILFLWRNRPTVTVGRHQNPWKECNLSLMDESGVTLARRYSGGGAVYQDLGCTTFTFIQKIGPSSSTARIIDSNFELLVDSLTSLGLPATRKGRNDLVVGDYKVSGSAFKQVPNKLIHHGTILVNTDMSRLGKFLTPSILKLKAKGISSVSARVSNLADLSSGVDHDILCESLARHFRGVYECTSTTEAEILDDVIQTDPVFRDHHDTLRSWDWRYGSTPDFEHTVSTRMEGIGLFDVHYDVTGGRITRIRIFSDSLLPDLVGRIQESLVGIEYRAHCVATTLSALATEQADEAGRAMVMEFSKWFTSALSVSV